MIKRSLILHHVRTLSRNLGIPCWNVLKLILPFWIFCLFSFQFIKRVGIYFRDFNCQNQKWTEHTHFTKLSSPTWKTLIARPVYLVAISLTSVTAFVQTGIAVCSVFTSFKWYKKNIYFLKMIPDWSCILKNQCSNL
jgi:hypothetical protein